MLLEKSKLIVLLFSTEIRVDEIMNEQKPLTADELRELQACAHPDESVSIPLYEGTTAAEAAKVTEKLAKKLENGQMSPDEARQYQVMQDIADKGGLTIDDVKEGDGPFKNNKDMLKGGAK